MTEKTDAILDAIKPSEESVTASKLVYPNLRSAMSQFGVLSFVWRSRDVVLRRRRVPTVAAVQHDLNVAYLLSASYRLQRAQTPVEKMFWTQQFSASSIRLFGRPVTKDVASLASSELDFFTQVANSLGTHESFAEPLLQTYRQLAKRGENHRPLEKRFTETMKSIREYFYDHYGDLFHCFDEYDDGGVLDPQELHDAFTKALNLLQQRDPAWGKWQVVMTNSGVLSVSIRTRHIRIGRKRVPVSSDDARGLFAHEVLVHAQRSVNGEKIAKELRAGLPGYLTAEEGLGVLVESAINKSVAYKVKDRYIDVALALGNYRRRGLTREELFLISYVRSVLRSLVDGSMVSLDEIEKSSWEHVNRIYRGTLGNKYVGVFTKDIAYYEGLVLMARYVARQHMKKSTGEIMKYVLQAKFDPTKKDHINRVKTLTK